MESNQPNNMVAGTLRVFDDTAYSTNLPPHYMARKKWVRPNPNLVHAFIPGTMLSVLVKAGQRVAEGDKLGIFVAMKMHNVILAPYSGLVKRVMVAEGERFPKGQELFEMGRE